MFHSLQCTIVNPFVAGISVLISVLKFLKSHSKKLGVSPFNNIKWIGFYRLIKLFFCMGQNAGYFNKTNQGYILFLFSF